ncbi:MAG: hypothetical protein RR478_04395 [Bacilli bacterium]
MDISTIYQEVDKIILKNLMINDDAMKICQSIGLNGFKRLHRCNIKNLLCKHLKLENNMYDKYRKVLETDILGSKYKIASIKEHLYTWKNSLSEDVKKLGELNKEHFNCVGVENCVIKETIEDMLHDYEKTCRWYCRFEETQWNLHDIHYLDDNLHQKYKELEKE